MFICLTAEERSEICDSGLLEKGFLVDELIEISANLPYHNSNVHIFRSPTSPLFSKEKRIESAVLIIKNGLKEIFEIDPDAMMKEQQSFLEDKRINKKSQCNVSFGEKNLEKKKETIISYDRAPLLRAWREKLPLFFGKKASNLEVRGNYYYEPKKYGFGFHDHSEKKIMISCYLGKSRPIFWKCFQKETGENYQFDLDHGDIYIMSQKLNKNDFKTGVTPL